MRGDDPGADEFRYHTGTIRRPDAPDAILIGGCPPPKGGGSGGSSLPQRHET